MLSPLPLLYSYLGLLPRLVSVIIGYEWVKFVQDFFGLGEPVLSFLGKDKPVFGEYFENTT